MFGELNEDAWAEILQYIDLQDQLTLMQVSEDMNTIVQNNWRNIKNAVMDVGVIEEFHKDPYKMHNFLQLASRTLQKLLMRGAYIEGMLPSWKSYDFPRLRSLDCHIWYTEGSDDNVTQLLTELFPYLTKLNLNSTSHGHYLCNFSQLQELSLTSSSLDTPTLDSIFGSLPIRKLSLFPFCTSNVGDLSLIYKCKTLEELLIYDYNMRFDMLRSLLKLPRFRRLSFYERDYYEDYMRDLEHLEQEFRVQSLLLNCCSYAYNLGSNIARFSNLRRLVIQDDNIGTKQLYIICSKLKHLEELHLIDILECPLAIDVWNMVGACRTLKVLNISNNKLDKYFLDESSTCLNRVLKRRNADSPVIFYVHNTRLADDPQETIDALNHPYLRISFDPIHIDTLANSSQPFIETEFRPLHSKV